MLTQQKCLHFVSRNGSEHGPASQCHKVLMWEPAGLGSVLGVWTITRWQNWIQFEPVVSPAAVWMFRRGTRCNLLIPNLRTCWFWTPGRFLRLLWKPLRTICCRQSEGNSMKQKFVLWITEKWLYISTVRLLYAPWLPPDYSLYQGRG